MTLILIFLGAVVSGFVWCTSSLFLQRISDKDEHMRMPLVIAFILTGACAVFAGIILAGMSALISVYLWESLAVVLGIGTIAGLLFGRKILGKISFSFPKIMKPKMLKESKVEPAKRSVYELFGEQN